MQKPIPSLFFSSILALLCSCTKYPLKPQDFQERTLAKLLCKEINHVRKRHDRQKLRNRSVLQKTAQEYASLLQKNIFFSHQNPLQEDQKTPLQRIIALGGARYSTLENLAKITIFQVPVSQKKFFILDREKGLFSILPNGPPLTYHTYKSASESIIQAWLDSPSHKKALLHPEMNTTGCGSSLFIDNNGIPMIIGVQLFQEEQTQ